ncbi:MAG TPA: winged helix-turn-helix domain-containing protein [archaeon]|nr:winged helix-turn-helix domain-containing protein [archaeon]
MFDRDIKKDQIDYLMRIKSALQLIENIESSSDQPQDDLLSTIKRLSQRVQKLEEKIDGETEDSIRKAKVREQILSLLQQHKRLSSSQLGDLVSLSRTRCNEYLRELSTQGLAEGVIVGRQKFYKLVK